MSIVFLVESWGTPWNEGYKNLARYIYETLKMHLNIDIFEKDSGDLSKIHCYDVIWAFNYPETPAAILQLLSLRGTNKTIVKEVAKKELNIDFKSKIKTLLLRRRLWNVVVVTTNLLKLELTRFIDGDRIFMLPPPILTDYFKHLNKDESRENLGFEKDKVYIGYAGTINRYRRFDIVFKALKNVAFKNMVFVLALANVRGKNLGVIEEAGKTHVPIKFVSTHDVRALYSSLDLLIYPVEREGSVEPPLTVLEAMSCGTPVAVLRTPITEKIIQDKQDGFLFSTPQELRTIIEGALEATLNESKISVNARKRILERFSPEKLRKAYLEVLETLCGGG